MALENCLRASTVRPQCLLPPLFSTSRDKLVVPTNRGFKKSVLNSKVSLPSFYSTAGSYRKSRFVCNAREAVNEGKLRIHHFATL